MATIKKRRKKRKHYKTGIHHSPKCSSGKIKYRSGWEKQVCLWLDNEPTVVSYGYECLKLPYISNLRTKKLRNYLPDFLVVYHDGTRKLIEVKRMDKIANAVVLKKSKAAREWCDLQQTKTTFEIWSNTMIEGITKLNVSRGLI